MVVENLPRIPLPYKECRSFHCCTIVSQIGEEHQFGNYFQNMVVHVMKEGEEIAQFIMISMGSNQIIGLFKSRFQHVRGAFKETENSDLILTVTNLFWAEKAFLDNRFNTDMDSSIRTVLGGKNDIGSAVFLGFSVQHTSGTFDDRYGYNSWQQEKGKYSKLRTAVSTFNVQQIKGVLVSFPLTMHDVIQCFQFWVACSELGYNVLVSYRDHNQLCAMLWMKGQIMEGEQTYILDLCKGNLGWVFLFSDLSIA